ncbi:hypothetical protein JL720_9147 [Aureococcus anophagefferens]|nr:hypothetical protein JL720_9147 [Aureococcus anophagefferens]
MSEVFAVWEDALYDKRKPEIIQEVDTKYCCLVEWEIIDGIPKEDPKETGKLDILAFVDESGLVGEMMDVLARKKHVGSKKLVPVWGNDDLLDAAKIEELLADEWDMLIFGAGVDLPESNDPDDIVVLIQRKPAYAKKIFVLTCDTHGNEPKTWAEAGPGLTAASHLFGMCNTCRIECAATPIHYVDAEFTVTDEIVEELANEVTRQAGFGENSVRINWRGRFVARMVLAEPRYTSNYKFQTPKSGTIGIGGGNGALGLVMCKYLLERLGDDRATVTLDIKMLSRSCKISGAGNEKLWNDIKKLIAGTSITVVQESCDVSKREAIEKFVEDNAASLSGFIHSAGILRDALLMNQDAEKYDDVFKPKAWAGLYLNHALEKFPCPKLEFMWMFSSVATYGNPGQSPYSAANSLLDSLARYRKSQGLPCTVMQWAGWGEVGMASNMEGLAKKRMDESPMPFFTNAQGLSGMDTGISTGVPNFCVMRYNTRLLRAEQQGGQIRRGRYGRKFWGCQAPSKELRSWTSRQRQGQLLRAAR